MIESYEDSVAYLISNGWVALNPGSYSKNGYKIVFDTSHYVELYKNNGERKAECPIHSVQDLVQFLQANNL